MVTRPNEGAPANRHPPLASAELLDWFALEVVGGVNSQVRSQRLGACDTAGISFPGIPVDRCRDWWQSSRQSPSDHGGRDKEVRFFWRGLLGQIQEKQRTRRCSE